MILIILKNYKKNVIYMLIKLSVDKVNIGFSKYYIGKKIIVEYIDNVLCSIYCDVIMEDFCCFVIMKFILLFCLFF